MGRLFRISQGLMDSGGREGLGKGTSLIKDGIG